MENNDTTYIKQIKTYCEDIENFIKRFGKDYQVFIEDRAYYNAVCMCIMQIGELANRLSEEFRDKTSKQMPWKLIRGMRNWIAHGYGEMDEEIIWETIINSIPDLALFCISVIKQEEEENI